MNIDFLKIVTLEEAVEAIQALTLAYRQSEEVSVETRLIDALGKTNDTTITANQDLPEFNRSTVDGYALIADDVQGASASIPSILTLTGEVLMGRGSDLEVTSGTCVYVPTGGMMPKGANAMVMIEATEKMSQDTLLVYEQVGYGASISYKGDDIRFGDVLIEAGRRIDAYDIALLAGLGISKVRTIKEPLFSVISTGDEIVDIDERCDPGQIRDINGYGIAAWLKSYGGHVARQAIIRDDFEALKESVSKALLDSDVIILSGGSSMGNRDYTKTLIESFEDGQVIHHGLASKPGKPTIIGKIGKKLVLGLPGHPVAAMLVCQNLVGAYMDQWFGRSQDKLMVEARITENIHGAPGRDMFQMVQLVKEGGAYRAQPIYGKSGLISTLSQATGWVKIPRSSEGVLAGDLVGVTLLQEVRI